MDLVTLASDPRVQVLAAAAGAMLVSTAHAYLDKHPRLQAVLRVVAHFTGPLNLPAMKAAGIALCRAVVAAEDVQFAKNISDKYGLKGVETGRTPSAGDVKEWPQR